MIKRYKESEINELAQILRNDGVVSVPTDTVFGICACINSKKAYDKLIEVKNRPMNKSFPVMCATIEQIKDIAIVDERNEKLIKSFMPGPITLVMNKRKSLPDYVTNGKDTIAIRVAPSKAIEELILKVGSPLLDGMMEGKVIYAKASTIVDCTSNVIKILREGPISLEEIMHVINK